MARAHAPVRDPGLAGPAAHNPECTPRYAHSRQFLLVVPRSLLWRPGNAL